MISMGSSTLPKYPGADPQTEVFIWAIAASAEGSKLGSACRDGSVVVVTTAVARANNTSFIQRSPFSYIKMIGGKERGSGGALLENIYGHSTTNIGKHENPNTVNL